MRHMQKGSKACRAEKKGECLKHIQTAQLKGPSGLAGLSLVGKASMSWSPIVRLDYGAIAPPCLGPTIRFACLQVPDPWETRQQS